MANPERVSHTIIMGEINEKNTETHWSVNESNSFYAGLALLAVE